jgi:hypothetical protein
MVHAKEYPMQQRQGHGITIIGTTMTVTIVTQQWPLVMHIKLL